MVAGWADEVVRGLTKVCNRMAKGHVPGIAHEYLTGASLAALPKPDREGLSPCVAVSAKPCGPR